MKCEICDRELKSYISLAQHICRYHGWTTEQYYLKYIGKIGVCKECGNPTTFHNINKGYHSFCGTKCSCTFSRRELKSDTERYEVFCDKVSDNLKTQWLTMDMTKRINNMSISAKNNIGKMTIEERKEKFGYLNKLTGEDRDKVISKMMKPLKDYYNKIYPYGRDTYGRFNIYRSQIRSLSNITYRRYKDIINPDGYHRGPDFHLDHIMSIVDGYKHKVPIEVMSSRYNLRVISSNDNLLKRYRSHIEVDELMRLYESSK